MRRSHRLLVGTFVLFLVVPAGGRADEKVFSRTVRGCVRLGGGSGVVVDEKDRLLITAYHVTRHLPSASVTFPVFDGSGRVVTDERFYRGFQPVRTARVIYADPWRDLAVLQLDGPLPGGVQALPLAPESPRPGQTIHLVGCAAFGEGGIFGYCQGTVRNVFPRRIPGGQTNFDRNIVEVQLATNKGDSGGPIVNDRAELVSIVSEGTIGAASPKGSVFYAKQIVDHDVDVDEIHAGLVTSKGIVQVFQGFVTEKDPTQVHVVALEPNHEYTIQLISNDFDTLLSIEDAGKKSLKRIDDYRRQLHSAVVLFPTKKEKVRLVASPLNAAFEFKKGPKGRKAGYRLQVAAFARDPQAALAVKGNLKNTDPKDAVLARPHQAHAVVLKAGKKYRMQADSRAFDPLLRLEGPDGTHLAFNDDKHDVEGPGDQRNAEIEFFCRKDGKHRLMVGAFNAGSAGAYELTVQGYEPAGKK